MPMDNTARQALFETILSDFGPSLRRLCVGYERNRAEQEELEQEVLLNLWRALPSFRGEASLRTWMYRVAHNTATKHCHRAMRQPKDTVGDQRLVHQATSEAGPDEQVAQADARARLQTHINALKPLDRQLMLLYLEDIPQSEIAEIVGLTQANVSTRVHRIKGELIKRMQT